MTRRAFQTPAALLLAAAFAWGAESPADIPAGEIVNVTCAADSAQSYALYLPSGYTPTREWKLILAFDAGARGRQGVERFQAAAEKYGYIVAGSNNSRNGPWEISLGAADAMSTDVVRRFKVDRKHIYTTGQSGGARVAMEIAMKYRTIAGVIASSAGFPEPDSPESSLAFPVYGTAGTEDFNYLEMRDLDKTLTSAHHIEIFEGGHTWLPSELAVKAIEWMEIRAMKAGTTPRDGALVKAIFNKRVAEADAIKDDFARMRALNAIATDFRDMPDVSTAALEKQAAELGKRPSVKEGAAADARILETEEKATVGLYSTLRKYIDAPENGIGEFRAQAMKLFSQSQAAEDSADRRLARRVLAGLRASSRGIDDKDYQKLLAEMQLTPAARPQ